MEFILENIVWLIAVAAGLVQWWKSTVEAKQERKLAEEARQRRIANGENLEDAEDERFEEFEDPYYEHPQQEFQPEPAPPPLPQQPRHSETQAPGGSPKPVLPKPKLFPRAAPETVSEKIPNEVANALMDKQKAIAERVRELRRSKAKAQAEEIGDAVAQRKPVVTVKTGAGSSIRKRLGDKQEIRHAFIMKEVLDKPVGLR